MQYIGQTTGPLYGRLGRHRDDARRFLAYPLYRAIRKYGMAAFMVHVVARCSSQEELNAEECRIIATYRTRRPYGYNIREGGARGRHSAATIEKLRKLNAGKRLSEAHKLAIREGLKRRDWKPSPEAIARFTIYARTRVWSAEQRQRFSEIAKKRPSISEETRKKMSVASSMRRATEEQKERFYRGENNPRAKLIAADVAEIRSIYESGGISQSDIAAAYGVNQTNVGFIVRGVSWPTTRNSTLS